MRGHRALIAAAALLPFAAAAQLLNPTDLVQEAPLWHELAPGAQTTETMVYLSATGHNLCWDAELEWWHCAFEFEVSPAEAEFTGLATASGSSDWQFHPVTLSPGTWKWQVREIDLSLQSPPTEWVAFNGGGAAFVITAPPAIEVEPVALEFGRQRLGTPALATLWVSNRGRGLLEVRALTLRGPSAQDFAVETDAPFTVAPHRSAQVTVRFTPSAGGPRSAALVIESNAVGPVLSVPLHGVGAAPSLRLGATALAFGEVKVGDAATLGVRVHNDGATDLILKGVMIGTGDAGDFVTWTKVPAIVVPGGSIRLQVTFAPLAGGRRESKLVIRSDDPVNAAVWLPLSGVGASPDIAVRPVAVEFGRLPVGSELTRAVTIENAGNAELVILAGEFLSIEGGRFWAPNIAGWKLPPGDQRTVTLGFEPLAVGPSRATFAVISDDPDARMVIVRLGGEGLSAAVTASEPCLDFGTQVTGRTTVRPVRLTNLTPRPMHVLGIRITGTGAGAFSLVPDERLERGDLAPRADVPSRGAELGPQALTLERGQTVEFRIGFHGRAAGLHRARLTFLIDPAEAPRVQLDLEAYAISHAFAIAPSTVDFAAVRVGQERVARLAVHNLTADPLTIQGAELSSMTPEFSVRLGDEAAGEAPFAQTVRDTVAVIDAVTVPAYGRIDLSARFAPQGAGQRAAELVLIAAGVEDAAAFARVELRGSGAAAPTEPPEEPVVEEEPRIGVLTDTGCGAAPASALPWSLALLAAAALRQRKNRARAMRR